MARTRQIRPGFFKNAELCELQPLVRLLFAGLWTVADCAGRLADRPRVLQGELLAYDRINVDKALDDLAGHGFIQRYEVDGHRFIQVINWHKHQHPHPREEPSTIPPPAGLRPDSDNEVHTQKPALGTISDAMTRAPVLVASSSSSSSSSRTSLREDPQTPPQAAGRSTGAGPPSPPGRPSPRANGTNPRARGTNPRRRRGLEFNDENGPQYEQRVGADGKREWVEIEAQS